MTEGKPVALITGGAQRVGKAIAERLAAAGFRVVITYQSSRGAAQEMESAIGATAIHVDLQDPEAASKLIADTIASSFGRIDVIVNNASFFPRAKLSETGQDLTRKLWAVHVESPMFICRALEELLRRSHGLVVNMLDASIERPAPAYMAYAASKAALANLTLSLARELAPQVRVNGIAPGVVLWPDDFPQASRDKLMAKIPLGRTGSPEDVAELVYFLATTGRYITGQIIRLDGGASLT